MNFGIGPKKTKKVPKKAKEIFLRGIEPQALLRHPHPNPN